jgi:hypothetical protein
MSNERPKASRPRDSIRRLPPSRRREPKASQVARLSPAVDANAHKPERVELVPQELAPVTLHGRVSEREP